MNVYGEIYLISNTKNSKKYIGLTTQGCKKRFAQHCKADSVIGRAIRKHGKDNFKIEVIDSGSSRKELASKEMYYVEKYDSFENGYNLTLGGEGIHLLKPIDINLNENQIKFVSKVNEDNKKPLDVNNNADMVRMILLNLMQTFLIAKQHRDKKQTAKLLNKLQSEYKKAVFDTNCITEKEVREWAC